MKILMSICSGIIMTGVAYSLYNAANDYGLATISLPPAITAQDDDTTGGDDTSGDPIDCYIPGTLCGFKQETIKYEDMQFFTDNRGAFTHIGGTACCFKPNACYNVCVDYIYCLITGASSDVCYSEKEGFFLTSVVEADDSSGDGTF